MLGTRMQHKQTLTAFLPIDDTDGEGVHLRLLAEKADSRLDEWATARAATERLAADEGNPSQPPF